MPNCTTDLTWYLGKFIIGFTGMLFLYVGFLKENEKNCICDIKIRELLRSEKMQNKCHLCECNKLMPTFLTQDDDTTISSDNIKCNKFHPKCRCARRNSC